MARLWTPEARAQHAVIMRSKIYEWQPWKHSTGARTPEGKAISAQNRAKSLERAKQRIEDAKKALRDAEAEHIRLTGNESLERIQQYARARARHL